MDAEDENVLELGRRAAAGDRSAVDELVQRELPRLRGFIRLRAGGALAPSESASDLVQSVCGEALAEAGALDFRGVAALRGWLYRAAERKLVDRVRRAAAVRRGGGAVHVPLLEDDLRETYASLLTPSRHAAAREELERLERCFAMLSPDHREVILLARIVGMSHAEIAADMGRSEGAVRALLFRALAELAELMRPRA